jgi:hypothetical protein
MHISPESYRRFRKFFTPFNQFGEPPQLIGLELIFWATIAIGESFVIAVVSEWKPAAPN